MSDGRRINEPMAADVADQVAAGSTHTLISASVLSSRVLTQLGTYLLSSASTLDDIKKLIKGEQPDGSYKPVAVISAVDDKSIEALGHALSNAVQPQLTEHAAALAAIRQTLAEHTSDLAASRQAIAAAAGEADRVPHLESRLADLGEQLGELREAQARGWAREDAREAAEIETEEALIDESEEMRQAHDVLIDRIAALEAAVRRLLARGPQDDENPSRPHPTPRPGTRGR